MTSVRIFVEEWHFGDEGWDFEVGARIQLPCEPFSTDDLAQVLQVWDAEVVQDVRYSAPVLTVEEAPVVAGVVTRIQALECRYPSPTGGVAIRRSGTAYDVQRARGWTGEVDFSKGVVEAFLIDLRLGD